MITPAIEALGFECLEESDTYVNRPPKQLEGRIYLKFLPRDNVA